MSTIAYQGKEPFAFISYSHADKIAVEKILRLIHQQEKRFWYDDGIAYGEEWEKVINERLESSSIFILFMTNGIEQRPEIIREIRMAIRKRNEDTNYKIFVVMLERVPVSYLFNRSGYEDLYELFSSVQYLSVADTHGVTISFLNLLMSSNIWKYCSTDEELKKIENGASEVHLSSLSDISFNSDYIFPYALPTIRKKDGITFYSLNIGETDPNAVYPICMDNQWVPSDYFDNSEFRDKGFNALNIEAEKNRKQQYEIISALLHNWQVLINRASIFNSAALSDWYFGCETEYEAFCELLRNGSFVIYLMKEKSPIEKPAFDVAEKQFQRWREICLKNKVYCIRMSWEDIDDGDEANRLEIERKISMRMMQLLLTTANDRNRLETFRRAMQISDEQADAFTALWRKIRGITLANDDYIQGSYARNNIYKDFLIKNGTSVPDCILDYKRPFVRELKQIIDFNYMINLPAALHINPVSSYEERLWDYLMSERRSTQKMRMISADELYCSVITFIPSFLTTIPFSEIANINLSETAKIRKLPEWKAYLESLDVSRKRANLNEIDFHDVEVVWKRFRQLMIACSRHLTKLHIREMSGSLSIIYYLGTARLITVYHQDSDIIQIKKANESDLSDNLRENVAIDFVCGDILKYSDVTNCFLEKLRLFEGILLQSGRMTYQKLLDALTSHTHTIL